MFKQNCSISPPEWTLPDSGQAITLHLRTITPMFGGGYETREVDPLCVIRPATIRGHLRFWWRATVGAQYTSAAKLFEEDAAKLFEEDAAKLFEEEEKIWGSASVPGQIAMAVQINQFGQKWKASQVATPQSSAKVGPQLKYFLWPFQEQSKEGIPEAEGRVDVQFTLRLSLSGNRDEAIEQVRRAVHAWITFGGIGARTRRGCGALVSDDLAWMPPSPEQKLKEWLDHLAGPKQSAACTHTVLTGGTLAVGSPCQEADEAWGKLSTFWAKFRKGHVGGKKYSPMSGGDWSDYRQTLVRRQKQANEIALAKPFLGLPINYQKFNTAPFWGVITSAETDRMASPIILKPAMFADGKIRPIVLVMQAPAPHRIRIKDKDSDPILLQVPTNDPVLQRLQTSNMLDAVLAAAKAEEVLDTRLFPMGGQ